MSPISFHWWPWGLVMQNSCELWGRCDNSKKPITNTKNEKNIFIIQNVLFGSGSALIFKIWKINVQKSICDLSAEKWTINRRRRVSWEQLTWMKSVIPAGWRYSWPEFIAFHAIVYSSEPSVDIFLFWNVFKKWLCVPLQPIKWPNDVPWMLMKHWRRHNKVSG